MAKKYKKAEKIIKELNENIENIETFAENFTKNFTTLMEKITTYLNTTNKLTLLGNLSNHPQETQKLQNDLQKYGLGIFLWFETEYPNISKVFDQCGFLPSVVKIKDVKKCIDDYNQLINQTSQKHNNLTKIEIQESQELFNKSHLDPVKNFVVKCHLWRKIDENTVIYLDIFFKTLPAIEIYIELYSKIVRFETRRFEVSKDRRGTKNISKATEQMFKRINKEFYKECPENIIKDIQKLGNFSKEITDDLDYINEHKREDFYNLLELSKDFYEFHIDLVKYILRLWHINEKGNRDYVNNYKIKHQFPEINKIANFYIIKKLMPNFPNLSRILIGFFFPFEKYRHIESHSAPNLEISDDEKYIFIPQKGKKGKLKVNIDEFQKHIRTYQSFIEAIGLYR